mmetsp:Transcript_4842/g.5883  ORF Transcript_4842/g.5883 Transcript_4842/m.5883 type:complete len:243 (+) Transcript_4842:343-1071(+)
MFGQCNKARKLQRENPKHTNIWKKSSCSLGTLEHNHSFGNTNQKHRFLPQPPPQILIGRLPAHNPGPEPILQLNRPAPRIRGAVTPAGNVVIIRRGHVRQPIASHRDGDREPDQSRHDGEGIGEKPIVFTRFAEESGGWYEPRTEGSDAQAGCRCLGVGCTTSCHTTTATPSFGCLPTEDHIGKLGIFVNLAPVILQTTIHHGSSFNIRDTQPAQISECRTTLAPDGTPGLIRVVHGARRRY